MACAYTTSFRVSKTLQKILSSGRFRALNPKSLLQMIDPSYHGSVCDQNVQIRLAKGVLIAITTGKRPWGPATAGLD